MPRREKTRALHMTTFFVDLFRPSPSPLLPASNSPSLRTQEGAFFGAPRGSFFFSPIHPFRAASFDPLFWHFCFQQTDGKRRNKNGCQKNGHPPILSEESLKKGRISDSKLPPRRNQRPRFSTSACSILFANCEDEERFASKQNGNQLPVFFSVFGRFCRT